jgi:hypothetical protein
MVTLLLHCADSSIAPLADLRAIAAFSRGDVRLAHLLIVLPPF